MDFQELETFVTIVQQGNFSRAADKLGYTQAAITIQIKKLEKELGVNLFDRLGRKTSLTTTGKVFYQNAIDILNAITRAKEAIDSKEELHGEIYIGTIDSLSSFVMQHIIKEFHNRYPSIKIKIITGTINELMEKLNNNDLDILYIADEKRNVSELVQKMEKEEKCLFVVSKEHELAGKTERGEMITIEELVTYPFLLTEKDASYRQLLDIHIDKYGYEIIPYLESTNPILILNMLPESGAVSLLPTYVVEGELNRGHLIPLMVENTEISIWHQIFYHKKKWITKEMDAFLKLIPVLFDK